MDKKIIEKLINDGLTIRKIAKELNTSFTNVRYWLKKYGLKTRMGSLKGKKRFDLKRSCKCGETNPEKFYGNKRNVCAKCQNQDVVRRSREKKRRIVQEMGGKCVICGFDKYACSLDFHHKDPSTKHHAFRCKTNWSWDKLVEESKKCVILCRNCHAALHQGLVDLPPDQTK